MTRQGCRKDRVEIMPQDTLGRYRGTERSTAALTRHLPTPTGWHDSELAGRNQRNCPADLCFSLDQGNLEKAKQLDGE